jgi:hypothetical protein
MLRRAAAEKKSNIKSVRRMIMNDELQRIWKETVLKGRNVSCRKPEKEPGVKPRTSACMHPGMLGI